MLLKDKNITIVGLSRTGIALARFLYSRGANIFISETKNLEDLKDALAAIKNIPVKLETGGHTEFIYQGKDLVILSPGVDINLPILNKASRFVELISELEFAYNLTDAKIIAVTGTNGKSTTTSLVYEILKTAGLPAAIGGNIGNPIINEIEKISKRGFLATEVSTFQLEGIKKFKPFIAFILNITPDHIDRHKSMGKYIRLKGRIFENQKEEDYLILNYDDDNCRALAPHAQSKIYFFSRTGEPPCGAFLKNDKICFKDGEQIEELADINEMFMRGVHNIENVLAAACALKILNIKSEVLRNVLKTFKPMRHRLEFTADIGGVKFYDDSKGTNPACVISALQSFSEPIILIAGGRPKETDFSAMAKLITQKVKYLVLVGEAKDILEKEVLKHKKIPFYKTDDFKEAVERAYKMSEKGDVVLLSPACTSFDMFKNAEERGDKFKEIARGIGDSAAASNA